MLLQKNPKGADLTCALTKTWAKSTIKSAEARTVKWSFGDARCSVQVKMPRQTLVSAMTDKEFKLFVTPHTAHCVVERNGKAEPVTATVAPKIVFKDGKAEKVWINLVDIKGPSDIADTLRFVARLEDTTGIFHRSMIKSINRFIYKHCPEKYPKAL
jgi:hypothetical protein